MNATRNERPYPMGAKDLARFMTKHAETAAGCWAWTSTISSKGYGRFYHGKSVAAHRASYQHYVGPIPDGLELDHLCRVRNCVNPAHLEPVTRVENVRRIQRPRPFGDDRCELGHQMTPENSFFQGTTICCRECSRQSKNQWGLQRMECPDCGMTVTKRNLAVHKRRRHKGLPAISILEESK